VRAKHDFEDRIKSTTVANLDLLPSNLKLRDLDLALDGVKHSDQRLGRLLSTVSRHYDLVVLDCPPSVSLVSENVVHAADVLLVPVVPATLSVRTLDQLTQFVSSVTDKPPQVLAFLSIADRRRIMHRQLAESLQVERSDVALTAIPDAAVVERMALRGAPVVATAPKSVAANAYQELWIEVSARLWPPLEVYRRQWSAE
jgi:cellulose biosynthesis protein BcsQ